ncbi:MAG: Hsp33 family molecular chaperone HslO [Treponemataceae bacterium]
MIRQELGDEALSARLSALPPDSILRFTLLNGTIRGALVSGSSLVASMRAQHRLGILETLALGQAYLAASLMSVTLKDGDRLTIRVDCTGVLKGFSVEAYWDGRLRGFLFADNIVLDKPLESFDLAPFIGKGTLSVSRLSPGGSPFTGHIELVHGRIAEDITEYFLRSEQIRTALVVSVKFDSSGRIAGAGGMFLQALPGAADLDVSDAEARLSDLPSLGDYFSRGFKCSDFLSQWFSTFEPNVMGSLPVGFVCDCNRERFTGYLAALPTSELESMLQDGEDPTEIICHYCSSTYHFSKEDLKTIIGKRPPKA